MSQPFDRGCRLSQPGEIDEELNEFWVESPWEIAARHNLSSFERNRAYLNVRGTDFLDVSYITGVDSDGDGRSAVAADIDNDGRMDLLVRQVGGGPLLVYANQFPRGHYLSLSLRGTNSNRLGIGARLVAVVGDRRIVREMYPANTYRSQSGSRLHFGLGDADRVDRLEIRWPSGHEQVLTDLAADRHVLVTEGLEQVEKVVPGVVMSP